MALTAVQIAAHLPAVQVGSTHCAAPEMAAEHGTQMSELRGGPDTFAELRDVVPGAPDDCCTGGIAGLCATCVVFVATSAEPSPTAGSTANVAVHASDLPQSAFHASDTPPPRS